MVKKKPVKKERYRIVISSRTDARKRPFVLNVTRRVLIIALCALPLVVFGTVGAAVMTWAEASDCSSEACALRDQSYVQLALIDTYSTELSSLRLDLEKYAAYSTKPSLKTEEAALAAMDTAGTDDAGGQIESGADNESVLAQYLKGYGQARPTAGNIPLIPMTDAISMINTDFQAAIDSKIEAIKAKESYDEFEIIYDGDFDGDSYAVSNWADVLSVYAAKTLYNGQKFLTITPDNIGVLSETYNSMNEVSIDTQKVVHEAVELDGVQTKDHITLKINIEVDSLTYSEEAEKHKFNSKQTKLLENLMSSNYYTYFADLLGIDVYDGMRSEQLDEIIANLQTGTTGEAIVKAALIRLGHPYSRGRRGSGNYVDCSYFTWWVYNQAGIKLPTSSVEQAKYCYNNGYTVKLKELKPGDLLFWRKTTCNCGRWKEIHHAGIYIGCGKVIDASSSKGRVIIRKLWESSEWKIAFAARPYDEPKSDEVIDETE